MKYSSREDAQEPNHWSPHEVRAQIARTSCEDLAQVAIHENCMFSSSVAVSATHTFDPWSLAAAVDVTSPSDADPVGDQLTNPLDGRSSFEPASASKRAAAATSRPRCSRPISLLSHLSKESLSSPLQADTFTLSGSVGAKRCDSTN